MMDNNDLISRAAAIEAVERREKLMTGDKRVGVEHVKTFLQNRPAVDAEPVRHGRWENAKAAFHKKCSHCKCILHMPRKRNFCPNCGAKMDGGEDNG